MIVSAPLNHPGEVDVLVDAGAGELYCGVLPGWWLRRYSPVCSLNRREWVEASLSSFRDFREVIKLAHNRSIPVYLTLNAQYFSSSQERDLRRYIRSAYSADVDGFFISDSGVISLVKEEASSAVIQVSSVAVLFNNRAVGFFRDLGVSRVNLPRHLTLKEIRSIVGAHPGFSFEAFILYNRCPNVDGLCSFLHGSEEFGLGDNACVIPFSIQEVPRSPKVRKNIKAHWEAFFSPDGFLLNTVFQCGLCALYDFRRWGVSAVKVIGRGKPLWMREFGVRLASGFIHYLEKENPSRRGFIHQVRGFVESNTFADRRRPCSPRNCYYPGVLS